MDDQETTSELKIELEADHLFGRALDLPADERQAFLEAACAGRDDLRAIVDELLEAVSLDDSLLDIERNHRVDWLSEAEHVLGAGAGVRIGAYRLLEIIGRGGMGVVYRAERADGAFEQQVALKLVHQTRQAGRLERFRQERQILASLDHPGIARLLDGGMTPDGLPYLVMDYVDGEPIDAYCDSRRLDTQQRVALFLQVCRAVGAAHQQLVVHRDIKPSNILVTADGTVKLLDFGIARLLDSAADALHAGPERTETHLERTRSMTPSWASPEQFRGRRITVASDIYQLGLLLYRMLTGRFPYKRKTDSVAEVEKLVCEVPASRASTVVRELSLDQDADALPPRHGFEDLDSWARSLRGDLDNILAKALAKSPDERYGSALALADDLERHLAQEPVLARSPTLGYIAWKFVGRHRLPVIAVACLLALSFVAGFGYARQLKTERDRAERALEAAEQARSEAEALSQSLVDLFALADPDRSADDPIDALELLERSLQQVRSDMTEHPLPRARFLHTIGDIYTKLGRRELAAELVEEGLTIREAHLPHEHPEVIESVNQLGFLLGRLGRYEEAEDLLVRALEARRRSGDLQLQAVTLNNLGNLHWRMSDYARAEQWHRQALALREDLGDPIRIGDSANNLGVLLNSRGRSKEAIPLLERAAEAHTEAYGTGHPTSAIAINNLAISELAQMRLDDAEEHFSAASVAWTKAYGPLHTRTLRADYNLAQLSFRRGDAETALGRVRSLIHRLESGDPPEERELARCRLLAGKALIDLGRLDEAEQELESSRKSRAELYGEQHDLTFSARVYLARIERLRGELEHAEAEFRALLLVLEPKYEASPTLILARLWNELGRTLLAKGELDEAELLLGKALQARERLMVEIHPELGDTRAALAELARIRG